MVWLLAVWFSASNMKFWSKRERDRVDNVHCGSKNSGHLSNICK